MKLDFRQRLLTTTLFVGVGALATPAFAQDAPPAHPECPPGVAPGTAGCNPADTAGTGGQPETTTPVEGQTNIPSTSATGEPVKSSQDIVITGTRIPQPNLTSASPVTVLSSQEVKLQGTSRAEDLINSLPQSFAAQGSNISNGSSGTATVNLRNLGASRTLVLVNGRRLMAGDILSPFADINFIPTQLIKRVDVLTGGASSTYGADAVGGVVNFIMDNTFTGVRLDAQASVFQHDNRNNGSIRTANENSGYRAPDGLSTNGGTADIAGIIGAAFDDGRGHVQAYATYRRQHAVLQSSRDYSFCGLSAASAAAVTGGANRFNCGGSATAATTNFFTNVGNFTLDDAGGLVSGYSVFNFNPYNYYQRPDERYTLGAFADYEISPAVKPYLEVMFMDDRSVAQIAPSGAFLGNISTLNCDNPLLSAEQAATLCDPANFVTNDAGDPVVLPNGTGGTFNQAVAFISRRNVEGGGRQDDIQHTAYRIVAGVRGDLLRGISYDASYQYGRVLRNETYINDFSIRNLARALDVVSVDADGTIVAPNAPGSTIACRSAVTGIDPLCVPYNIFAPNAVTPEALNYLQTPGFQRGTTEEAIAHADVTIQGAEYGLKTPWAENGIGFNFGAEYRKEKAQLRVDSEFLSGDLAGQGGPTPNVAGEFDVREAFIETQIPIVEHSFIDLLQVSAGYRYSNYKVADNEFNTKTYKVAAEFAPIRDIRFRASYNRAVRAPNVTELFFPQSVGLFGTFDPCAGDFDATTNQPAPTASLAQCQLTGVTAAQYGNIFVNPANQYNGLAGGNTELRPEKADSYTAGVIIQPRFIPGLALTADYFNIKVKNVIGSESYGSVINQCIGAGGFDQDPTECAFIHRDANGSLFLSPNGYVEVLNRNFSGTGLKTKGWDFSGSYSRRLGFLGTLNASFVGTLQGKTATLGGAGTGFFSPDSIPINKFRSKTRVGFTLPNGIGLSGQWRHFSSVKCDADAFPGPCSRPANAKIDAQDYFDLAMTARLTNKFNLRFGANNIFDKAPPVVGSQVLTGVFGNGNTYPQIYDALGRYMFAGVTVDF